MQTKEIYGGNKTSKTHPELSLRGMIIGGTGAAVITASSLYVALKLSALPWPIVFAALLSIFFLRALGRTSLNEANVTHTAMSAGAMVAGGLAFTIPGYWILGGEEGISFFQVLLIALAGVALGLVATAVVRHYFIDKTKLAFPVGVSAAEALLAANEATTKRSAALFSALGLAALYAFVRDNLLKLSPVAFASEKLPGVALGVYNSPMMLAVGFMIGPIACFVWFFGALIGNFGIVLGGTAAGCWSLELATATKTTLGLGLMLGAGAGVVLAQLLNLITKKLGGHVVGDEKGAVALTSEAAAVQEVAAQKQDIPRQVFSKRIMLLAAPLVSAAVVAVAAWLLGLGLIPSILLVLGTWIAALMSSQSVGMTGIDPMEVFGILVLLVVLVFCHGLSMLSLFFIAAIVAVACGLTGDVMNDFKAGAILGTNPRAQWTAQAIGGLIGAVVASLVLFALVNTFGADSFGEGKMFSAAQAGIVAAMVGGIQPGLTFTAFFIGLLVGLILTVLRLPCMTLGLGVYLPFCLSFTAFLGGLIKLAYDLITKRKKQAQGMGLAVAAGIIGGESLIGVIVALVALGISAFAF